MAIKIRNKAEIKDYLVEQVKRYELALIYALEYFVAELQNHAKLNAGYKDQTANLKSSIGGVLLHNGKAISYSSFVKESGNNSAPITGNTTGLEVLNSLIPRYKTGFVIILVVGMSYATYVENYRNKNVLKKTELYMRQELPRLLKDLDL